MRMSPLDSLMEEGSKSLTMLWFLSALTRSYMKICKNSNPPWILNVNHKDRFDTVLDYDVWPNYKNITEFFQQHYQIPYYDFNQK